MPMIFPAPVRCFSTHKKQISPTLYQSFLPEIFTYFIECEINITNNLIFILIEIFIFIFLFG